MSFPIYLSDPRHVEAYFYEQAWGPLPNVVETQGKHLVAGFETPVLHDGEFDPKFYDKLHYALLTLQEKQASRAELLYGDDIAREYCIGHTPPSVRAQFQSEEHYDIRQFIKHVEPPTPSTRCNTPVPEPSPPSTSSSSDGTTSPPTPTLSQGTVRKREQGQNRCGENYGVHHIPAQASFVH